MKIEKLTAEVPTVLTAITLISELEGRTRIILPVYLRDQIKISEKHEEHAIHLISKERVS